MQNGGALGDGSRAGDRFGERKAAPTTFKHMEFGQPVRARPAPLECHQSGAPGTPWPVLNVELRCHTVSVRPDCPAALSWIKSVARRRPMIDVKSWAPARESYCSANPFFWYTGFASADARNLISAFAPLVSFACPLA